MSKQKVFIALVVIVAIVAFVFGRKYFASNTGTFKDKTFFYIRTNSSYDEVIKGLQNNHIVDDIKSFESVANQFNLKSNIHPGRYEIKQGMGNYTIVNILRKGRQTPVKLVLRKMRTAQDVITKISSTLEADSVVLKNMFNDNIYLKQWGLDSNSAIAAIFPDTYEFYWNTSAEKVYEKIAKSYTKYWDDNHKKKAEQLNLSPRQVMTLASIVDEETNYDPEKGKIASVYLNRLKKGMKLQADPTVKYAVGDFTIRRVLNKHLTTASPYNTYYVAGLPPGPICTPERSSIDAVLNAPQTSYLFFCASEKMNGTHNFAASDAEHMTNAKKFQEALNQRGITK